MITSCVCDLTAHVPLQEKGYRKHQHRGDVFAVGLGGSEAQAAEGQVARPKQVAVQT